MDLPSHYLSDLLALIDRTRNLADGAIRQLGDDELFRTIDAESNSVAIIMRHVAGNLRSRFTDFLTTDGEKPDRHRDGEFEVQEGLTRDALQAAFDAGFKTFSDAVAALRPEDVLREVTIRGERMTVVQALQRAIAHLSYHVGQIVFLAKHLRSDTWRTLSIPRGQSETYRP
jgi:uncharacterized damage-inducible protein DinB